LPINRILECRYRIENVLAGIYDDHVTRKDGRTMVQYFQQYEKPLLMVRNQMPVQLNKKQQWSGY